MKRNVAVLWLILVAGMLNADDKKDFKPSKTELSKFLTEYHKTPVAKRGELVTDPKEYNRLQEAYYKGSEVPDESTIDVKSVTHDPKIGYYVADAERTVKFKSKVFSAPQSYYVALADGVFKLDWSATVGYNETGHKAWSAGEDTTITLRVVAELDTYYNYHYAEAKLTHYSINVKEEYMDRTASFHGYVAKDSELGKKIFAITKDGQKHNMTFLFAKTGTETSVVGIKNVVSTLWVK